MSSMQDVAQERAGPEPDDAATAVDRGVGEEAEATRGTLRRALTAVAQAIAVLAVLGGGAAIALHVLRTGPKAERKPAPRQARLVEVEVVRPTTEPVTVHAMGAVSAARRAELRPRVSGEIVWLSPECIPGGRFHRGAEIARIDPADYELAVEQQTTEVERLTALWEQRKSEVAERQSAVLQREADVVQAEAALRIEQGQQAIARREFELLDRAVKEEDRELVLRRPQLRSAEAACKAARAALSAAQAMARSAQAAADAAEAAKDAAEVALKQAKLDQQRTVLRAPFDAVVESRAVEVGSQVSVGSQLATLVGTGEYWVEVSVPVDELKWIDIPRGRGQAGSPARVYDEAAWGRGVCRQGTVLRLASALEPEGRMARLLVAVPDPLALEDANAGKPPLLLGSYVRVEIDGQKLEDVIAIDRDRLRDGDRVWVMDENGALDIRRVDIRYRGRERVLVDGALRGGERVVVTDLAAPVAGMPLRVEGDGSPAAPAGQGARHE